MGTAKRLKSNKEVDLFLGLVAFVEDRIFDDKSSDDYVLYTTLMDLLLQQMEFLKQDMDACNLHFGLDEFLYSALYGDYDPSKFGKE